MVREGVSIVLFLIILDFFVILKVNNKLDFDIKLFKFSKVIFLRSKIVFNAIEDSSME